MNYSQYLDRLVQLIALNQRNGQPMTAAVLGSFASNSIPDASFKDFGKRHLREVLADLEKAKLVRITATPKGALAVELCGNSPAPASIDAGPAPPRNTPLKKAAWEAFVFSAPAGKRFGHRASGTIRIGLAESPTPIEEWVELAPITHDLQLNWATDFVEREVDPQEIEPWEALRVAEWNPVAFARTLRNHNPDLAKRWNAHRSKLTATHVRTWLTQVGLPESWAFESETHTASAATPTADVKELSSSAASSSVHSSPDAETREVILAALAQLPLSKLLELPIPAGVLLNTMASRLPR